MTRGICLLELATLRYMLLLLLLWNSHPYSSDHTTDNSSSESQPPCGPETFETHFTFCIAVDFGGDAVCHTRHDSTAEILNRHQKTPRRALV